MMSDQYIPNFQNLSNDLFINIHAECQSFWGYRLGCSQRNPIGWLSRAPALASCSKKIIVRRTYVRAISLQFLFSASTHISPYLKAIPILFEYELAAHV